jgi:hypothetical protein
VRLGSALLILSLVACTNVGQAPTPMAVTQLDRATFNACHGNEGFALRVYSVGKLRFPGTANTQDARTQPLTQAENDANYQSAIAFTYGGPAADDNLLIRKPLPAAAGGFEHVGGAIFSGTDDPCVQQIRAWLSGISTECPNPGICQ